MNPCGDGMPAMWLSGICQTPAVRLFGEQVGVALFPHARELDRRGRNVAVPGIAVLEEDFLGAVEELGAVEVEVGGEVVDVGGRFPVVRQHKDPQGGGGGALVPGKDAHGQAVGPFPCDGDVDQLGGAEVAELPVHLHPGDEGPAPGRELQIPEVYRFEVGIEIA